MTVDLKGLDLKLAEIKKPLNLKERKMSEKVKASDVTVNNMTLEFLLGNKLPVFVVNKSNPRGDVTIQYFKPSGDPDILLVPKTWIPIRLDDQASWKTLEDCNDLKRNLMNRMLELVTPTEANKMLSEVEAKEEYDRLSVSKFASYGKNIKQTKKSSDIFVDEMHDISKIAINVQDIVGRDITDNEKYHLLRAEEDLLKEEDFKYIISKVEKDGKLKDWATEKYEELINESKK